MREAAQGCRGCELFKEGTQAVFGEGPARADTMLVGEQPGDVEDLTGEPFVGPAGKLLRQVLANVGLDVESLYLTNAVKHFHWKAAGKRRLHQKPQMRHIKACHPWLEAEVARIEPSLIVCLGASAAASVFGKAVTIRDLRGRFVASPLCENTLVTVHPSSILRAPDTESRQEALAAFENDFEKVLRFVARKPVAKGHRAASSDNRRSSNA
jgi:DNA polymerase